MCFLFPFSGFRFFVNVINHFLPLILFLLRKLSHRSHYLFNKCPSDPYWTHTHTGRNNNRNNPFYVQHMLNSTGRSHGSTAHVVSAARKASASAHCRDSDSVYVNPPDKAYNGITPTQICTILSLIRVLKPSNLQVAALYRLPFFCWRSLLQPQLLTVHDTSFLWSMRDQCIRSHPDIFLCAVYLLSALRMSDHCLYPHDLCFKSLP